MNLAKAGFWNTRLQLGSATGSGATLGARSTQRTMAPHFIHAAVEMETRCGCVFSKNVFKVQHCFNFPWTDIFGGISRFEGVDAVAAAVSHHTGRDLLTQLQLGGCHFKVATSRGRLCAWVTSWFAGQPWTGWTCDVREHPLVTDLAPVAAATVGGIGFHLNQTGVALQV